MTHGNHEELGAKVRRAQLAVEQIRGVGTVDGVTVQVSADNTIISIDGPASVKPETVLEAYRIALRDKEPRVEAAMRDVLQDARVSQLSTFTDSRGRREPGPEHHAIDQEEEAWDRIQQDPLGRRDQL
ncbi:hypothetical protein [Rhodococcus sp. HNM0569]|uniref:hypothetical protein n=1 Tax=Rhodococcus sp. HNM0569 TaxID=2716340 RepID=UPI00146D76AD|nr:hypothetical protein [Rhodococcus sp. HNM0569]NLU83026.1 hypothetical protein [Rhodococcus sp. HNM0569]